MRRYHVFDTWYKTVAVSTSKQLSFQGRPRFYGMLVQAGPMLRQCSVLVQSAWCIGDLQRMESLALLVKMCDNCIWTSYFSSVIHVYPLALDFRSIRKKKIPCQALGRGVSSHDTASTGFAQWRGFRDATQVRVLSKRAPCRRAAFPALVHTANTLLCLRSGYWVL